MPFRIFMWVTLPFVLSSVRIAIWGAEYKWVGTIDGVNINSGWIWNEWTTTTSQLYRPRTIQLLSLMEHGAVLLLQLLSWKMEMTARSDDHNYYELIFLPRIYLLSNRVAPWLVIISSLSYPVSWYTYKIMQEAEIINCASPSATDR